MEKGTSLGKTANLEAAKEDQLLTPLLRSSSWMSCLDSGGSVRTIFVDFRKAFDLVLLGMGVTEQR